MKHVPRSIEPVLLRACRSFPACVVTGPRRAGKTWLLRHLFPKATYVLLEDPDVIGRVQADPRGFLDALRGPVIFDEIQNVPHLVPYLRTRIDSEPRRVGRWLLTGSREAPMMQHIGESLAGRAAVFQLLPFSVQEFPRWNLLLGGYPEVVARPKSAPLWFSSYLQTYLERDVRALTSIRDLPTFRRFLALLASRHGQILNKTELAAPLGVSVPTIAQWLHILEATFQIVLVPPYYENFAKRIVKSPKVYWTDPGLTAYLLGIESAAMLEKSVFLGSLFEGFTASEIVKAQLNSGRRKEIYFFRDRTGLEVDFVVPVRSETLLLVEAKASRTIVPRDAIPLRRLAGAVKNRKTRSIIVHRRSASGPTMKTVAPGVEAMSVVELSRLIEK